MSMFCYQCQETARNVGCETRGICGKSPEVSNMQDLLVYVCKGLAYVALEAKKSGIDTNEIDKFIVKGLFITITNANFDNDAIIVAIKKALHLRDALIKKLPKIPEHDAVTWNGTTPDELERKSIEVGVLSTDSDEDIRSLKQYVTYGLKGIAAYAEHAFNLGFEEEEIFKFLEEAMVMTTQLQTIDDMLNWVDKTGACGVRVMALLDKAHTSTYGHPEITTVHLGVRSRPGILISGHDLKDLDDLLNQSEGKGIDIYTHSEMLPAHAYPKFKKFDHFAGNYGGSWHQQTTDFETFNGPVLFTTNCIVPPPKAASYDNRIFTTGSAGYPNCIHITAHLPNGQKNFSQIIEMALTCKPPREIEAGSLTIGFAHNQVLALADKIVDAVKSGAIRKMVVMAGCDGRQKSRAYYTEFAEKLPKDTVILTSGCAKYRYNKLNLGDINGIPRILDAGQCNDSYSWAVVAMKLKEVFELNDINELPLYFNIAWYEQKAIIVHLALLHLGFKNMHIGPTLPTFLSPNVLQVAKELFGLETIQQVEEDLMLV